MKTFKILGLLLTYPSGDIYSAAGDIVENLREEGLLSAKTISKLDSFLRNQQTRDLLEAQEEYVDLFDRGRAHCLHLFEHIHGESRDRGPAMIDLMETYKQKGLYIESGELPDYLPLFLEFLSYCSLQEAVSLLGEAIDVIALIGGKLQQRNSPYADIFAAIEELSAVKADKKKIAEAIKNSPKDPQTLEELDEQWKEAEAFGDANADCHGCNAFPNTTETLQKLAGGAS